MRKSQNLDFSQRGFYIFKLQEFIKTKKYFVETNQQKKEKILFFNYIFVIINRF